MDEDKLNPRGNRKGIAALAPANRSAKTNNRRQFLDGDGRSLWARRHRDIAQLHVDDLGGADELSEAQMSLIRRAATIECELERLDSQLSRDKSVDLGHYSTVANSLRRILESLGLKRVASAINGRELTLDEIKRHLAAEREAKEAELE